MMPTRHVPDDPPSSGRSPLQQFAAELHRLLDGAQGCIDLARRDLHADRISHGMPAAFRPDRRLRLASDALRRMERMLRPAMQGQSLPPLPPDCGTLNDALDAAVAAHAPLARALGVQIDVQVPLVTGGIVVQGVGAILDSALRCVMEACSAPDLAARRIEISAVHCGRDLRLFITDTGCGLARRESCGCGDDLDGPDRSHHGPAAPHAAWSAGADPDAPDLATLARHIARVGGWMRLTSVPFGEGAVLQVHVPVAESGA